MSSTQDEILFPNGHVCSVLRKVNHAAMIHFDNIPGMQEDREVIQSVLGTTAFLTFIAFSLCHFLGFFYVHGFVYLRSFDFLLLCFRISIAWIFFFFWCAATSDFCLFGSFLCVFCCCCFFFCMFILICFLGIDDWCGFGGVSSCYMFKYLHLHVCVSVSGNCRSGFYFWHTAMVI